MHCIGASCLRRQQQSKRFIFHLRISCDVTDVQLCIRFVVNCEYRCRFPFSIFFFLHFHSCAFHFVSSPHGTRRNTEFSVEPIFGISHIVIIIIIIIAYARRTPSLTRTRSNAILQWCKYYENFHILFRAAALLPCSTITIELSDIVTNAQCLCVSLNASASLHGFTEK